MLTKPYVVCGTKSRLGRQVVWLSRIFSRIASRKTRYDHVNDLSVITILTQGSVRALMKFWLVLTLLLMASLATGVSSTSVSMGPQPTEAVLSTMSLDMPPNTAWTSTLRRLSRSVLRLGDRSSWSATLSVSAKAVLTAPAFP